MRHARGSGEARDYVQVVNGNRPGVSVALEQAELLGDGQLGGDAGEVLERNGDRHHAAEAGLLDLNDPAGGLFLEANSAVAVQNADDTERLNERILNIFADGLLQPGATATQSFGGDAFALGVNDNQERCRREFKMRLVVGTK